MDVDSWLPCVTLRMSNPRFQSPEPAVTVSREHHTHVRGEAQEQSWGGWAAGTAQLSTAQWGKVWPGSTNPKFLWHPQQLHSQSLRWVGATQWFLSWIKPHWQDDTTSTGIPGQQVANARLAVNAHFLSFQAHEFYLCPNFSAFMKFCSYRTSLCSPFMKNNF